MPTTIMRGECGREPLENCNGPYLPTSNRLQICQFHLFSPKNQWQKTLRNFQHTNNGGPNTAAKKDISEVNFLKNRCRWHVPSRRWIYSKHCQLFGRKLYSLVYWKKFKLFFFWSEGHTRDLVYASFQLESQLQNNFFHKAKMTCTITKLPNSKESTGK